MNKKSDSKSNRINGETLFWGLLLVGVGVLFLLNNLGLTSLYIGNIFQLWPLAIVAAGISVLSLTGRTSLLINVIVGVLAIVLLLVAVTREDGLYVRGSEKQGESASARTIDIHEDTEELKLAIKAGANSIDLNPATDKTTLVQAELSGSERFSLSDTVQRDGSVQNVTLKTDSRGPVGFLTGPDTTLDVKISKTVPVTLDIDAGVSSIDANLSEVRVKNLKFDGGVSNAEFKIGTREPKVYIDIDAGVSNTELHIPSGTGLRVVHDGGLSSTNFAGAEKVDDHTYETHGFAQAARQIIVKSDGGLSSFTITRDDR